MSEIRGMLTVLVGSKAHGLDTALSDEDYRSVFLQPTSDLLKIGGGHIKSTWVEGQENERTQRVDDTGWEVGHFLFLATKSNPSILECFLAPVETATEDGLRVRELFPHVWSGYAVRDAFIGYGLNQRKKLLDDREPELRQAKYAVAYLRTLFQAKELLESGTFTIRVAESEIGSTLKRWKAGAFQMGEVIDTCRTWSIAVESAYEKYGKDKQTNLEPVNAFLLDLRRREW